MTLKILLTWRFSDPPLFDWVEWYVEIMWNGDSFLVSSPVFYSRHLHFYLLFGIQNSNHNFFFIWWGRIYFLFNENEILHNFTRFLFFFFSKWIISKKVWAFRVLSTGYGLNLRSLCLHVSDYWVHWIFIWSGVIHGSLSSCIWVVCDKSPSV